MGVTKAIRSEVQGFLNSEALVTEKDILLAQQTLLADQGDNNATIMLERAIESLSKVLCNEEELKELKKAMEKSNRGLNSTYGIQFIQYLKNRVHNL